MEQFLENNSQEEQTDNDRLLMAKYFFGNQSFNTSKSELGMWLQSFPEGEGFQYANKNVSVDNWFRISRTEELYPIIDIQMNFSGEREGEDPYISVVSKKSPQEKESDIFFFNKESFEEMKEFIHAQIVSTT